MEYPEDWEDDHALRTEELAAFAHRLWVHWSTHIAEEENISEDRLDRWEELWTEYENLSEEMKDKDRELVKELLYSSLDNRNKSDEGDV